MLIERSSLLADSIAGGKLYHEQSAGGKRAKRSHVRSSRSIR
ncbi:MAG TPA: hypothetical protein VLT59_10205 [Steroidobacteraceae bacterium]|nr:hypothetical protein [Steroidobacteraceae bacterium]